MRRPLQGYGYLGAWDERPFVREVRRETGKRLTSTHNSLLEAQLGAGIVGALALVAFVALVFWLTAGLAVRHRDVQSTIPFALVIFVIVENLTETLVVGNQLAVALLSATGVAAWRGGSRAGSTDPASGDLEGVEQTVSGGVRPVMQQRLAPGGAGDSPP